MRHTQSTLVRLLRNAAISLIGCALLLTIAPIAEAQTIYAMTQSGRFGTFDVSTLTFTPVSDPGFEPAGLAGLGTNLFVTSYPGNTLYEVNLANGNLTAIGNGSITYYAFGGTAQGLYGIGTDTNLYSVNTSTGATTLVGPTGIPTGGYQAMSSDGATLYAAASPSTSFLYSVNTSTGAATVIGNTGATNISSIGFANGQLYAADESGNFYTLSVSTGAATLLGNSGQAFWGQALPPLTLNALHNFTGRIDGSNPFAGVTLDAGGRVYGTAGAGGNGSCSYDGLTGCGTAFKLTHSSGGWIFAPLYSFAGGTNDGEFPTRPLTIGPNGSIYGATVGGGEGTCTFDGATGCGITFNLTPSPTFPRTPLQPWLEKVLYHFTGEGDGGVPFSSPLFDHSGNMYGTTAVGGANNLGAVYKLTPAGGGNWTESVLYSFAGGSDGAGPSDGLISDSAGNFYGTTAGGGGAAPCQRGCGTVYELSPSGSGWTEKILYTFQGTNDGMYPNSGVAMDAMGNLYGNTWEGGSGGGGTVYKLTPSGGGNYSFSVIYSVPVAGFAVGRVILDSSGNVYEALQNGGTYNDGQVFKLTPSNGNWIFTDLHDFTGGIDGSNAIGGLALDSSGNLYGTTLFGGANTCNAGAYTCGLVYEIAP